MKIVLASTSAVKIAACRAAFGEAHEIVPVKVSSGVAEQPMNQETLTGAFNRIRGARAAVPGADIYISIENGVFEEDRKYIDRAVVTLAVGDAKPQTFYSDGVEFPADCVEIARARGFNEWTVGKIMEERGVVAKHDDPHATLSGKSRTAYINDVLKAAVGSLKL